MQQLRPLVFGEVLFDRFPDGAAVLGGAPFNVAWHLQAFGAAPLFVSRVGKDAAGADVLEAMRSWGMDTRAIQQDSRRPTGTVEVRFESDGEPRYSIVADSAWDAIDVDALPAFRKEWLLYHGSLALRGTASATALLRLRERAASKIACDVNLRAPWYHRTELLALLRQSQWIKLNEDELELLLPGERDPVAALQKLGGGRAEGLLLTRGAAGAVLVRSDGEAPLHIAPAGELPVVDSVGAGDAFCSVLIIGILRRWPPAVLLARAQDFAGRVLGVRGAITRDPVFYQQVLRTWEEEDSNV